MSNSSRHKSCLGCIQTKRKCDRTLPKCQRCIARGSQCQYIGRNRNEPQRNTNIDIDELDIISNSLCEQPSSKWRSQQYHAGSASLFTDNTLFEFPNQPFDLGSISGDNSLVLDSIHAIVAQQPPKSPSPCDERTVLSDLRLQTCVEFVANRLAAIPNAFVEQGHAMFIHRVQFQTTCSPALQDGMSACALYGMKTVANQRFVFQNLESRCQQLIRSTDALLASRLDLLAALQALLLYQLIRLFDGDIRLRANAEADESTVISWARQLMPDMCSAEQAALTPPIQAGWQSWLVDESIRRTVITAFMLKGVYGFLKLGYDSPTELRLYFTAQTAIWDAQSEIGWRRALIEREALEVRVTHWEEVMAKAKPIDLEELGILVMSMLRGLDATRVWLGRDYSIRHGLEL